MEFKNKINATWNCSWESIKTVYAVIALQLQYVVPVFSVSALHVACEALLLNRVPGILLYRLHVGNGSVDLSRTSRHKV